MLDLCRFDQLSSGGSEKTEPEDDLRASLHVLARIIARELIRKERCPSSHHLTEESPLGLLDHGERGE